LVLDSYVNNYWVSANKNYLTHKWNHGRPLLGVIREFVQVPDVSTISSGPHEEDFVEEEDPGWGEVADGVKEAFQSGKGFQSGGRRCKEKWGCCHSEAKPFNPLAKVVWVRDVLVEQAGGNGVVLAL